MSRWRSVAEAFFGAAWYLLIVIAVPVLVFMVAGLLYFLEHGSLLLVLSIWLGIAMLAYAGAYGYRLLRLRRGSITDKSAAVDALPDAGAELPERLSERADWSAQDIEIWLTCCTRIDLALEQGLGWSALQRQALVLLASIAGHYHGDRQHAQWRFTLPEGLLIVEEASRRYRQLVGERVPYADRVTIASVMNLYQRQDQIKRGIVWADRARRLLRLINPLGAVLGELRDQVTDRVFARVSSATQSALKRLLLQELAQVGIDLYSGRLKVSDSELASYRSVALQSAAARAPIATEPLQVLVVGQISAGKSSLINALIDNLGAETDLLPTTDRTSVHRLQTEDGLAVHLLDTPGIEGGGTNVDSLANLAGHADLIVWVSRATQPGRAADTLLHDRIQARFAAQPERRPPPILLVVTHVDALPPRAQWSPPYDLSGGGEGDKAANISAALTSVREQIGLAADVGAVPVCLSAQRGLYNVDVLLTRIMALAEAAAQTQLNRRRVEKAGSAPGWRARLGQIRKLGTMVGRGVLERASSRRRR